MYHPFLSAAMFGPEDLSQHLRHSEMRRKELGEELRPLYGTDTYDSNGRDFAHAVAQAEKQGKIPLANEHWFNVVKVDIVLDLIRGKIQQPAELGRNPTCIPDDISILSRP